MNFDRNKVEMVKRQYIEGELGAAVEVAPGFDFHEDEQPAFPEPENEEEQEFGGMSM